MMSKVSQTLMVAAICLQFKSVDSAKLSVKKSTIHRVSINSDIGVPLRSIIPRSTLPRSILPRSTLPQSTLPRSILPQSTLSRSPINFINSKPFASKPISTAKNTDTKLKLKLKSRVTIKSKLLRFKTAPTIRRVMPKVLAVRNTKNYLPVISGFVTDANDAFSFLTKMASIRRVQKFHLRRVRSSHGFRKFVKSGFSL